MSRHLCDLLAEAVQRWPGAEHSVHGGGPTTFADLQRAAERVAGGLLAAGMRPEQRVLLLVDDPADFFAAFWGVVWAGGTPVPLAPPRPRPGELERVGRVAALVAGPIVVDRGVEPPPGIAVLDVGALLAAPPLSCPIRTTAPGLVQFSSGSTGHPRGVVLSQGNLLANVEQIADRLGLRPDDRVLTWMPHYHDMGLIGCHLLPLFTGSHQRRMHWLEAMGDPVEWLRAASAHASTVLSTTNFGLARLCARLETEGTGGLSLAAVRMLANGAEPISAAVCRRFCALTGLPERVHLPMYGLAEMTVGVSASHGRPLRTLAHEGREVVCIGPPLRGVEARISSDGELQLRGPNRMVGYLGDDEATAAALTADGWLRTGDLACLDDGEIAILGRIKDVVIVGGRNLYPDDIEQVAEAVPGVKSGGAVALSDTRGESEALVVGVLVAPGHDAARVLPAVRQAVEAEIGTEVGEVIPLERIPRTTSGKKQRARLRAALAAGELDDHVGNTATLVLAAFGQALGRSLDESWLDRPLGELGGTSLQAVEALARLDERLGRASDHRLLRRASTLRALARLIERAPHDPTGRRPSLLRDHGEDRAPIAIVAVACRLPGSGDVVAFWDDLAGPTRIGSAPADRGFQQDRRGAFLDQVDRFDAARFGIEARHASAMDPQQRLALELAADALGPRRSDERVGVYVGASQQAYLEVVLDQLAEPLPPETLAGNLLSMLAARIAHELDLRGPALTVDTACSASLVALHLAARALRTGDCDAALVGGINLNLSETVFRLFDLAGALSPTGRCLPFSPDADGTVPGEGGGFFLLRPLSAARARGETVLGVVRGTAVNNDGRSLGVMAPNPAGQEEVLWRALAEAGVTASAIAYVEAHGSATPVGDRVEDAVLRRVYPHDPPRGSAKAHVGHLLGAAGAVGLLRLLGELSPGQLGAVSSFGFGGTNAHAILEGGERPAAKPTDARAGARHWLGEEPADGWVHVVARDPAGGLSWSPCPDGPSPLRQGGAYLLTGGTGGVGRALARYLARRYRARLVLVGRSPLGPRQALLLAQLERAGAQARYLTVDLSDPLATEAMVAAVRAAIGVPDGVFHLAGGLDAAGLEAKAGPLEAMRSLAPGFWCLFSSIAAVVPGLDRGLEAYAEQNRALDRWAAVRHREGVHAVSIAWGPWSGGGLAAEHAGALTARGIAAIRPAVAMTALEHALGSRRPHVVVLHRGAPVGVGEVPLGEDLEEYLTGLLARAAKVAPDAVGRHTTLSELGLDSIVALDLVKELEDRLGIALPTTLLYEHDSVAAIAAALRAGHHRQLPEAEATDGDAPLDGLPLLPSQLTFVVQRRFFPDMPGNVFMAVTVDPPLVRSELEAAVARVVARHPVLGSVVRKVGDSHRLVAGGRVDLAWRDTLDEDAIANEPFDLERGPLERIYSDGRRLVLNGHHSVVDAWSQRNVLVELLSEPAALPVLGATWSDCVRALATATDDGLDPWAARYPDGIPPLHLAWSAPVTEPSAGGCGLDLRRLDARATASLAEVARGIGVSLTALTLALYMRVLFDESGQPDVVVRVAHARRESRLSGIEHVVGSFADSLPVRATVGLTTGLYDLARRLQSELAWVQDHAGSSSMALASLAEQQPAGPVGLTPVGFSFPRLPMPSQIGPHTLSDAAGRAGAGFTRLALLAWLFDGQLHLGFSYARSHLRPDAVARIAGRLLVLAEALARGEDPTPVAPASRLHRAVLARCAQHPERHAVGSLRYGDLTRRSAALARALEPATRTGSPVRVAVAAHPGEHAVVALLAVLRTGAAFVPIDPAWPDARVRQILDVAAPAAVVTPTESLARLTRLAGGRPVLPITDETAEEGPDREGDIAYVMFTSGSTGRPKGVVVSHHAVLVFLAWVERAFGVTEADRFVQTASLGYGGAIRQIFSPLLAGGSIWPVTPEERRDPDALVALLHRHRITIYNSVPSLWAHLMDAAERAPVAEPFAHLRWVLVGGEAVPVELVRRWRQRYPGRVANLYGSTETIVNATFHEVLEAPAEDARATPIGWARGGVEVALVDVEDGIGEVVVGGAIASGYHDAPEQTAEAFVAHPTLGRVYRTGDLARRGPQGLVFVGRRDQQVQVHGNRVELGEIEATLGGHPAIGAAIVVFRDQRLEATVETADGEVPPGLFDWVAARLPAPMVPHRFAAVAELPRNAAGKADRQALRAQPVRSGARRDLPREPTGGAALSAHVAAAWQEVLGLAHLPAPSDDFFALGGDSIRALEVLDRLRPHLSGDIRPLLLYRHRTLGALAGALAALPSRKVEGRSAADGAAPLSEVQRGFWTAHHKSGTAPVFCVRVPVRGPVDHRALAPALDLVVTRHEVLRSRFRLERGRPEQVDAEPASIPLQYDDLSRLAPAQRERALAARWEEAAATDFPLDRWPLLSLRLCRVGHAEHELLVACHHIVSDAWSTWILANELIEAHDHLVAGRPWLPAPAPSFRAARQAERPESDRWWADALADLEQLPAAPRLRGDTPHPEDRASSVRIELPPRVWERLKALARREHVSPFVVVLHALFAALAEVTGSRDTVVATAITGRDASSADSARVVGPFARGLPVRVRGDVDRGRVARAFEDAAAHSQASAASIAAAVGGSALEVLGRYFLTWLDPAAVPAATGSLAIDWARGRFRFATGSTATELMVGALALDGLHLHLDGGALVHRVAPALEGHLRRAAGVDAALVVYAPAGVDNPLRAPASIERVDTREGCSELVLLPLGADALTAGPSLERLIVEAVAESDASVVALAGMLPARTGLGTRPTLPGGRVLTTGHAATVVAMLLTLERVLTSRSLSIGDLHVGYLGHGAIGQAVHALCEHVLGLPKRTTVSDPVEGGQHLLDGCDLVLGATSGGVGLDVTTLRSGTIVIDDSFPRAFDETLALQRMRERRDVLLVGGGQLDVGRLWRWSPYPQAPALRQQYGDRWLPGCHAEALLLAARPDLGPTVGVVTLARALAVRDAMLSLHWAAPPLHLGPWVVPDDVRP